MTALRAAHPGVPVTYSIGETWPLELTELPDSAQVAHFHFYVYGVLGALYEAVGLGHGTAPRPREDRWPTATLAGMLRPDAPTREEYRPDASWQSSATGINHDLFYVHDWVDPDRWDLWLYEHYQEHRLAMEAQLAQWTDAVARARGAVAGAGGAGRRRRRVHAAADAFRRGCRRQAPCRVQRCGAALMPDSGASS